MSEEKRKRSKKALLVFKTHAKHPALEELRALAMEHHRKKYPSVPSFARPPIKFEDYTSGGLTKCILTWLQLNGWQAERISSTGRYIPGQQLPADVLGHVRTTAGRFIPPASTNGTADISATILGRSIKIEIKLAKDKMSPAQERYQEAVERAGGVYIIARNFPDFLAWYKEFTKNI